MDRRHAGSAGSVVAAWLLWAVTSAVGAAPVAVGWKVLLPDGRPAAGARVYVRAAKVADQSVVDLECVTDADGVFSAEVDLDPKPNANGYRDRAFVVVDVPDCALLAAAVPEAGAAGPTETKLSPAFEITGRIVGSDGQAVAGAEVVVMRARPADVDWKTASWALNLYTWHARFAPLVTQTDADGAFRLRGLTTASGPAAIVVTASADGRYSASPRSVDPRAEVTAGADTPPLSLTVRTPIAVSGTVANLVTGEPVAGAEVRAIAYPYSAVEPIAPVPTDAEGRFSIAGIPTVENLYVEATHGDLARAWQKLPATQSSRDVQLRVRPWTTVSGHLVDQDTGKPPVMPGVWLHVVWDAGQLQGTEAHDARIEPGYAQAQTDADGRFTARTVAGSNKITVRCYGYRGTDPAQFDVPGEGLADLEVPVAKEPSYLVHLVTKSPLGLNDVGVQYLKDNGEASGAGSQPTTGWWHWPAEAWGAKLAIRITRGTKEVVPWRVLVASPDAWPVVVEVP